MIETVNPLKRLGKCFFYDVEKTEGFLPKIELVEKTHIVAQAPGFYNSSLSFCSPQEFLENKKSNKNSGFPIERTLIFVGKDYSGSLQLPKGTESISVYDLKDKSQVIIYEHRFSRIDTESKFVPSSLVPFANEMRSPDNRVEIEDIVKMNIKRTTDSSDEEEKEHSDEIQGCF